MIVKVEIDGDVALITTKPGEKPGVHIRVPASRVRTRFTERAASVVGYFVATEAMSKNESTGEEYPLDVVELGDRVSLPESEGW